MWSLHLVSCCGIRLRSLQFRGIRIKCREVPRRKPDEHLRVERLGEIVQPGSIIRADRVRNIAAIVPLRQHELIVEGVGNLVRHWLQEKGCLVVLTALPEALLIIRERLTLSIMTVDMTDCVTIG